MGRRRHRRHLRPLPAAVLFTGTVERARRHPQGARIRPDIQRGQPRRGREGLLLLRRQHAHPQLHEAAVQVPAGRFSLPATGGRKPRPRGRRAGVRTAGHRRLRRGPLLRRVRRICEGRCRRHLHPDRGLEPRPRRRRAAPAAAIVVPQYLGLGRNTAAPARHLAGYPECRPRRPGRGRQPGRWPEKPAIQVPARASSPVWRPRRQAPVHRQ